jgi:methionyl aminopeptidase
MKPLNLKSPQQIKKMAKAGLLLSEVKEKLKAQVKPGISAYEIEDLATSLIQKSKARPSFKMVPGYHWSTCINVGSGVVHGIPKKTTIFKKNDVVSVDVGLFLNSFHADTSFSVYLGQDPKIINFLKAGQEALNGAIKKAIPGNKIKDISSQMESTLKSHNLTPISTLTGHGIGNNLHEEPRVPCLLTGSKDESITLKAGLVLAIEVMYTIGNDTLVLEDDGWTLSTKSGKISALFEETVAITDNGPIVLTDPKGKTSK